MTTTGQKRTLCAARRADGTPCRAYASNDTLFCNSHDPQRAGVMAAARRAGGQARHGRSIGPTGDASPVTLDSLADVLSVLTEAVNEVRGLERSIGKTRAIAYLASVWADCYATSELERRVAALEALQHGDATDAR